MIVVSILSRGSDDNIDDDDAKYKTGKDCFITVYHRHNLGFDWNNYTTMKLFNFLQEFFGQIARYYRTSQAVGRIDDR